MKKLFYIILRLFYIILSFLLADLTYAVDGTIKGALLEGVNPSEAAVNLGTGKEGLTSVFIYAKDTIFGLLALIVIGTFLYIGYKIIISRGNPEEFKKAFMMFIYAIIGLLIVSLAWVIVMFVSGLNL